MKHLLLSLLIIMSVGCKSGDPERTDPPAPDTPATKVKVQEEPLSVPEFYNFDTLSLDGALVNGHKIVVPQKAFERAYPGLDSAKTDLWECGSPFGYLDGAWMEKTYGPYDSSTGEYGTFDGYLTTLFVQNASFVSNGHVVLFDQGEAAHNTFRIAGTNIVLDKNTSLEAFERTFPKLVRERMDNPEKYRYRLSLGKKMDDAFLFEFRRGKLYSFRLWWLLC